MNNDCRVPNCTENPLRKEMDLVNQQAIWEAKHGKIVTVELMSQEELIHMNRGKTLNEQACDINAKKSRQLAKQLQREAEFKKGRAKP